MKAPSLVAAVLLASLAAANLLLPSAALDHGPSAAPTPTSWAGDVASARPATLYLPELPLPGKSATAPPLAPVGWTDLMVQGFEEVFPSPGWAVYGNPTWGRTAYRQRSGNHSAYTAAAGSLRVSPPGPYPHNMNAWMVYGPFDLRSANAAELRFQHWTKTEAAANNKLDYVCAVASKNGSRFGGNCWYGDWTNSIGAVDGWVPGVLDLANVPDVGNLLGQSQVWIAFAFFSDASVALEGVYLDDIVLRVHTGPFETPTPTPPSPACPGASMRSYLTAEDNENNRLTGLPDYDMYPAYPSCIYRNNPLQPIEFRVHVNALPAFNQAQLSLRVWDVDEQNATCPEVDEVHLNGVHVGNLTGADSVWSTTVLDVPTSLVRVGGNLVQVRINTLNCQHPEQPAGWWCAAVHWGQLVLGGGGAASIRSAGADRACYEPSATINVALEVDTTLASQEVRAEVNVLDAAQNNLVGSTQAQTIAGSQDDPFTFSLSVPEATTPGDYRLQIIVFDVCSNTQSDYRELPIRIAETCPTPTPTRTSTSTPTATATSTAAPTSTPTATATFPASRALYLPLVTR